MPALFRRSSLPARDDPLLRRLAWLCPAVTVLAFAALLLLFGLSLWTAAALALLVACPVAAGWAIVAERRVAAETRRRHR
jgi:hypothetical protein